MTIAIGIVVQDGVVLGADTLYTDGFTKSYGKKVFSTVAVDFSLAFALAGSRAVGRMAIEECETRFSEINSGDCTVSKVAGIIKRVVKRIHEKYVDTKPYEERNAARFSLLVAISMRGSRARLYGSCDAAFYPIDDFDCMGTGAQIGRYIVEPSYHSDLDIREAGRLVAHALAAAKERVDGVGGRSHIIAVQNGGLSSPIVELGDLEQYEQQTLRFRQRASNLLRDLSNTGISDVEFEKCLATFNDETLDQRAALTGMLYERLSLMLSTLQASRSDQSPTKASQSPQQPSPGSLGGSGES